MLLHDLYDETYPVTVTTNFDRSKSVGREPVGLFYIGVLIFSSQRRLMSIKCTVTGLILGLAQPMRDVVTM